MLREVICNELVSQLRKIDLILVVVGKSYDCVGPFASVQDLTIRSCQATVEFSGIKITLTDTASNDVFFSLFVCFFVYFYYYFFRYSITTVSAGRSHSAVIDGKLVGHGRRSLAKMCRGR